MGAVCSAGTMDRTASEYGNRSSGKLRVMRSFGRPRGVPSYSYPSEDQNGETSGYDSGESQLSMISRELKPSTPARVTPTKSPQASSFLGKAGIVSLDRAVSVLDTLGSSMTSMNVSSGFVSNTTSKGIKISILAFEVANTIAKGSNLLLSLSEENVQFLKKEILYSEGVQLLVSTDMTELLTIAAADKRDEFNVFSREVQRFGNLCKDPQWHNLGRFFSRLDLDPANHKQLRQEAEVTMQRLTTLAKHTSELYHELNALDRCELEYRRKLEEVESLNLPRRGESVMMLRSDLKHQKKLVRSLKKKSLWSKTLEEVVEKLVDIVTFIHQEISEAFGDNVAGVTSIDKESTNKTDRLGAAGLALHYANMITQIDNVASRPISIPPNMRDTLYHGLPVSVKTAFRSKVHKVDAKEALTIPQIKAEMEKTLQWLVPIATDTTKSHQGFGWVGEWANTGDFGKKTGTTNNIVRLQTFYHADKKKMDGYILELVMWLHRLISRVRYGDFGKKSMPLRSPTLKGSNLPETSASNCKIQSDKISWEDRNLLNGVMNQRRLVPGISKSQEFIMGKASGGRILATSRSTGSSPRRESQRPKTDILDKLDGLETTPVCAF